MDIFFAEKLLGFFKCPGPKISQQQRNGLSQSVPIVVADKPRGKMRTIADIIGVDIHFVIKGKFADRHVAKHLLTHILSRNMRNEV